MSGTGSLCSTPPTDPKDWANFLVPLTTSQIVLGFVLVFGSVITYIPQHVAILKRKSTDGISPLFLFVSALQQWSSVLNAFLMKFPQIKGCKYAPWAKCWPDMIPLVQLVCLFAAAFPLFIFVLYYIPRSPHRESDAYPAWKRNKIVSWSAFLTLCGYIMVTLLYAINLLVVHGPCDRPVRFYGGGLGYVAMVGNIACYTPQIWETWVKKSEGSFSLLMLAIQIPGSIAMVYFFAFAEKESVTTWISYFVSGVEQVILMILLLYYRRINRAKGLDRSGSYYEGKEGEKKDSTTRAIPIAVNIARESDPLIVGSPLESPVDFRINRKAKE